MCYNNKKYSECSFISLSICLSLCVSLILSLLSWINLLSPSESVMSCIQNPETLWFALGLQWNKRCHKHELFLFTPQPNVMTKYVEWMYLSAQQQVVFCMAVGKHMRANTNWTPEVGEKYPCHSFNCFFYNVQSNKLKFSPVASVGWQLLPCWWVGQEVTNGL